MRGAAFRSMMAGYVRLIHEIGNDIEAAATLGERKLVKSAFKVFGDTISNATTLLMEYLPIKAARLSATHEEAGRRWDKGTPPEILEDMRLMVSFYQSFANELERTASEADEVESRNLERKRIQYLRQGALRIRIGKIEIVKQDPSFWTPALENEFHDWLKYPLS